MTDSSTAGGYFPTRRIAKRTPSRYGKASSERTSSWGNQDGGMGIREPDAGGDPACFVVLEPQG